MFSERWVEIAAESDAKFDGRTWVGLSNADKQRYLSRSRAAIEAIHKYVHESIAAAMAEEEAQDEGN